MEKSPQQDLSSVKDHVALQMNTYIMNTNQGEIFRSRLEEILVLCVLTILFVFVNYIDVCLYFTDFIRTLIVIFS